MKASTVALGAMCAVAFLLDSSSAVFAISASGDSGQPSTMTDHNILGGSGGPGFQITEGVALDAAAGPWIKNLINSGGQGIASGVDRAITETLFNVGNVPWTDWHERIVSRTTINSPNDAPGFLFRENSLALQADYGSGLVNLVQGTHYTIATMDYSGPPDGGNNFNWESIDIFFQPGFAITPGDTLVIQKRIFEVFLDGNIWTNGEAAVVAQYPTPEPGSAAVCVICAMAAMRRRHR